MTLSEKIKEDLKTALKSGNGNLAGTLRLLISELYNKAKEKQGKGGEAILSDEEFISVLQKEAKKRKDSIALFKKGGRADLSEKEEAELKVVEAYLPSRASAEEIDSTVEALIAAGVKDFGSLMKEAMKKLQGRADGREVGDIVKKKLGQ